MAKFNRFSVSVDDETHEMILLYVNKKGLSLSEGSRELLKKGLALEQSSESLDLISSVVRSQVDASMKIHVERLARMISKTGHMASTSTFLNVQALQDLVPVERKKEVVTLYENARKKAVVYFKKSTDDFDSSVEFKEKE